MNKATTILWRTVYILIAVFWLLFWISVHKDSVVYYPPKNGAPFFFENQRNYWGAIEDYLVCKDKLFVLYGRKAILECYDLNGNYLYSYSFFSDGGGAFLFIDKGNTVLIGSDYDSYIFSPDSGLVEHNAADLSNWKLQYKKNPELDVIADNGDRYELHWASIYKISPNGNRERVIKRPFWMILFQNHLCIQLSFFLACIVAIRELVKRRKEKLAKRKATDNDMGS